MRRRSNRFAVIAWGFRTGILYIHATSLLRHWIKGSGANSIQA